MLVFISHEDKHSEDYSVVRSKAGAEILAQNAFNQQSEQSEYVLRGGFNDDARQVKALKLLSNELSRTKFLGTKMKNFITRSEPERIEYIPFNNSPRSLWLERNQAFTSNIHGSKADIVICITLYNEIYQYLKETLISIGKSIKHLINTDISQQKVKVCIIADGLDRLNPGVIRGMKELGISIPNYYPENLDGIHIVNQPLSLITIKGEDALRSSVQPQLSDFDLLFCTKSKNSGKLDSHWWFFTKLCSFFNPEYCFQVDAGTKLESNTLHSMLLTLQKDSSHAAVASNVLIEASNPKDLLQSFQCMDFIIQRSIYWPAENLWGYLSVVPGQCCGIHWPSLSDETGDRGSPLSRYLKGMNCKTAKEKIMFLAEDRVMGFELMANKGSDNRLSYSTSADCFTDACDDLQELLKQRRRWVNSAFVCRSWTMANMGRYWRDSSTATHKKLQAMGSYVSMIWSHCFDWFMPITLMLSVYGIGLSMKGIAEHFAMAPLWSVLGAGSVGLLWLLPAALALLGILQRQSKKTVQKVIAVSASATGLVVALSVCSVIVNMQTHSNLNPWALYFMLFSHIVFLGATMLGEHALKIYQRTYVQFFLCSLPIYLMLNFYAFTNMSDSSWGTKGLQKKQVGLTEEEKLLQKKLNRFGRRFVFRWISSNVFIFSLLLFYGLAMDALIVISASVILYYFLGVINLVLMNLREGRHSKSMESLSLSSESEAGNL